MTARESIKTTLLNLRRQCNQGEQVHLSAQTLTTWTEAGVHLLLACVLAGAAILGDHAPLGVALVGAAGPGLNGGAALIGSAMGYLSLLDFSSALRYLSAAILTYAVAFAFYDLKPIRRTWAMPVIAALFTGFTGFLVESQMGWRPGRGVHLALEVALTALCAWAFRAALSPMSLERENRLNSPARQGGVLVLAACLLISLLSLPPWGSVAPARLLAVPAVLAAARQGGPASGIVVGAALGLASDLTGPGVPLRCGLYAACGLIVGLTRGRDRWAAVLSGWTVTALAVLWLYDLPQAPGLLWEGLVGSSLLFLIPAPALRRLGVWLTPELGGPSDLRARDMAKQKLQAAAQAFHTLGDSLHTAFRPPENDNDVASIFDRTAHRVCRHCTLRDRCWHQDYTGTFNALNDATAPMVERGRAENGDFPRHFADRCIHFPDFVNAVNEELTALFYRRQYNARIRESRAAVCRQYTQLSQLLDATAAEMGSELTPDLFFDRLVRRRVAELGLDVRTAVFRDKRGLLRLQAEGPAAAELSRPSRLTDLGQLLNAPLRVELEGEGSLSLLQQEPLMAVAGVAARKKTGETVSGDAGTYFKRPDGTVYLLLCDGMGTGPEANRESSRAVRLLESFLMAGVEPCHALTTLSSALALQGEETGGFTTVDLLQVDLFQGECKLFKLGAAPTYVRKEDSIQRFLGASLPAGLAEGTASAIDQFSFQLEPGDCVLMVSDGICTAEDDGWVQDRLRAFHEGSPKDLARDLVTDAPQNPSDDRTALVIRLEHRKP